MPPVPSTPPGRDTAPVTLPPPSKIATTCTIPSTIPPVIINVLKDVVKIYGFLDSYADTLVTALFILYEVDDRVSVTVDTIL